MADQRPIFIVLGYGCQLTVPVQNYLDRVVSFARQMKPSAIIATGGFTEPRAALGVSEAAMMAQYLKFNGVTARIFKDELAWTTQENLHNSAAILYQKHAQDRPLVVFCNRAHKVKVAALSLLLLPTMPQIRTYPIASSFKQTIDQVLIATPLTLLATQIPWFHRREMQRKQRMIVGS